MKPEPDFLPPEPCVELAFSFRRREGAELLQASVLIVYDTQGQAKGFAGRAPVPSVLWRWSRLRGKQSFLFFKNKERGAA